MNYLSLLTLLLLLLNYQIITIAYCFNIFLNTKISLILKIITYLSQSVWATITKYCRVGGLSTTEVYFSHFGRLQDQNQDAGLTHCLVTESNVSSNSGKARDFLGSLILKLFMKTPSNLKGPTCKYHYIGGQVLT